MVRAAAVAISLVFLAPLTVKAADQDGEPVLKQQGKASYYGDDFHGKKTATGERLDQDKLTTASKTLPLGSKATVTNQETGKSVDVEINDRGPYAKGRVIDVTKKAAEKLDMKEDGVAPVTVEARPSQQPDPEVKEKITEKAEAQEKKPR